MTRSINSKGAAAKAKPNISDRIFDCLKGRIVEGYWKPGQKIDSENKLCETLQVSRITVRTAIQRLISLGMLESRQGDGTYVCNNISLSNFNSFLPMIAFDQLDYISMFEFRKIIEVESAGMAAQRATSQMVAEMRQASVHMEKAETAEEITNYDMEFHYLLAKATNNEIIIKVFEVLRDAYKRLLEDNVSKIGAYGAKYHHLILNAIEMRNVELAKKHMLDHLNDVIQKTTSMSAEAYSSAEE